MVQTFLMLKELLVIYSKIISKWKVFLKETMTSRLCCKPFSPSAVYKKNWLKKFFEEGVDMNLPTWMFIHNLPISIHLLFIATFFTCKPD